MKIDALEQARRRYRFLLRLAPKRLRDRHAVEMEESFLAMWRDARAAGRGAIFAVWLRAILDLVWARRHRPFTLASQRSPTRRAPLMLGTELRYALRSFRRQRLSTLLILTMLTLGMAANIVVFSLVNELFIKPFPFPEPERLVYINEKAPQWNLERTGIQYPDFFRWRESAVVFDGLGIYDDTNFNLSDDRGADRIEGARVTFDFFPTLGVMPLRGRLFRVDEDRPNGPRVALISEWLWQERFARDEGVLSRTLQLNGRTFEIIGVLPRRAEFPIRARVWIPLAADPNQMWNYSLEAIGRLKPGVSVASGEQDLLRAHQPIFDERDHDRVVSPFAEPLRAVLVRDFEQIATALGVAVLLLLVVACANVAAVMLARAIARRREMGIRLAVGANRWRLLRQLFVENVLLAVIGGVIGLAAGRWVLGFLISTAGDVLPSWTTFDFDVRLVGFSALITMLTTVLFGWVPAFHAVRGDLRSAMTDASAATTTSARGRRTLLWLVGAEFALAAVLLVGGGLLYRAFGEVKKVDPGFRADNVLSFWVSLPAATYSDGQARLGFWTRLLDRVRSSPGVEAAGVITCPPLSCHWGNFYRIEGRPPLKPGETDPVVLSRVATDGYFQAMGLSLRAGRFFEPQDGGPGTEQVVVVNEMFAKTFWPGERDVIGKRIAFNGDRNPWMKVVGVTADVKHYGLERPVRPGLYFPARMLADRTAAMAVIVRLRSQGASGQVRTANDPEAFAGTARAIVRDLDPSLPVYRVGSMERVLADSMRQRATYSWMLAVFAGLAVILALGGTYGVTSYLVTQQHREIGIRLAMGARAADIIRGVLSGSLIPVSAGLVLGIVGAMLLAGLLTDLLFGVSPRDPSAIIAAVITLAVTAVIANWLPARRAARASPMTSLRT